MSAKKDTANPSKVRITEIKPQPPKLSAVEPHNTPNLGQSITDIFNSVGKSYDFSKQRNILNPKQRFSDEKGHFGEMADKKIKGERIKD